MAAAAGSCLSFWREENEALVRRWRRAAERSGPEASCIVGECQRAFTELLQKIQAGLPAALPALPLELTILYNALLFELQQPGSSSGENPLARMAYSLHRVLEACGVPGQGLSLEDAWHRLLQERVPGGLMGSLHQLAALQGALWLAAKHPEKAESLFQQLSPGQSPEPSLLHGRPGGLLPLLQQWRPPEEGDSDPLPAQSVRDLKSVLWTSAAFLQGVQDLEAEDHPSALAFLQAAATGLCSKRFLAQIFTLMGRCSLKVGKPQVALRYLREALRVDFTFLPALYQAALLYRQLGLVEAELHSLELLHQALEGHAQVAAEPSAPPFLIRAELLVRGQQQTTLFAQNCPPGVKCLLAQRCLQAGRVSEASEHYLDLLALLQEQPVCQCGEPALPRVPEVFLEAASTLVQLAQPEEALVVCEEVVARTSELVPKKLCMELDPSAQEAPFGAEGPSLADPRVLLQKQKRESLRCVLWRAAAYLIQGWAWAQRGEAKEATCCMSRCLNDLLKVHFVNSGSPEAEIEQAGMPEGKVLPQVRQLALTGRGTQFLELGQAKEALRDFQHSLLVNPESPTANLYYTHTLWKVGRRQEAAERWQKLRLDPASLEEKPERPLPLHLRLYGKQLAFPHVDSLTRNIESFLEEVQRGCCLSAPTSCPFT